MALEKTFSWPLVWLQQIKNQKYMIKWVKLSDQYLQLLEIRYRDWESACDTTCSSENVLVKLLRALKDCIASIKSKPFLWRQ